MKRISRRYRAGNVPELPNVIWDKILYDHGRGQIDTFFNKAMRDHVNLDVELGKAVRGRSNPDCIKKYPSACTAICKWVNKGVDTHLSISESDLDVVIHTALKYLFDNTDELCFVNAELGREFGYRPNNLVDEASLRCKLLALVGKGKTALEHSVMIGVKGEDPFTPERMEKVMKEFQRIKQYTVGIGKWGYLSFYGVIGETRFSYVFFKNTFYWLDHDNHVKTSNSFPSFENFKCKMIKLSSIGVEIIRNNYTKYPVQWWRPV